MQKADPCLGPDPASPGIGAYAHDQQHQPMSINTDQDGSLMPIRFQVDADFYDHPKTIDMSDAATALWTRAGSYSAAKLTDGFVADAVLVRLSSVPEEASGELVRRGLWRRVRGGFRFHQWGERNLTRARVEADREADRQRKRAERHTSRVTHQATCHTCGHTYVTARSDAKYCSTKCRKKASREANPQVGTEVVHPDSEPDSERNPNGFHPLSVSVSVSESVSVSGRPPDVPPPRRCPAHETDPDPPRCGACAEARRANDQWTADRDARIRAAPRCREHPDQPAHNCAPCRSEQIGAA